MLHPPSKVTIEGLLPLVGCGHLESVAMILDGKAPDTTSLQRPGNGASNLSLSILEVRHSLINDPHAATSFLSDVFPHLIIITWSGFNGTKEDDLEGWEMSVQWMRQWDCINCLLTSGQVSYLSPWTTAKQCHVTYGKVHHGGKQLKIKD